MAIDKVRFQLGTKEQDDEIWETTGPIPDEMVAQRLAMIPIPTVHDKFYFQDECPNCKDLVEAGQGLLRMPDDLHMCGLRNLRKDVGLLQAT